MRVVQELPLAQSKYQLIFKDSPLAHEYCAGEGLEIGAAAHNPFNLSDCLNVADERGFDFYKQSQIDMCGAWVSADVLADAAAIPFGDELEDYIISSHMIEHHPDPIACILEWYRLLKVGGVIFMIFPKRDALDTDRGRAITELDAITDAHDMGLTVETAPEPPGGKGGHYYVYTLDSMTALVRYISTQYNLNLKIGLALETDDKVGNGHLMVLHKIEAPVVVAPVKKARKAKAE